MLMVQTKLVRDGSTYTVAWVPYDSKVKPGSKLRLSKNGPEWEVVEQWAKEEKAE